VKRIKLNAQYRPEGLSGLNRFFLPVFAEGRGEEMEVRRTEGRKLIHPKMNLRAGSISQQLLLISKCPSPM